MGFSTQSWFSVPEATDIHQAITAFLRTSEFGECHLDSNKQNDAFVLNFYRGKERTSWERFNSSKYLRFINENRFPSLFANIRVILRPLPKAVKVGIDYHFPIINPTGNEDSKQLLNKCVDREVSALLCYLQEFYEISEPLRIEAPPNE